jgi:PIN domain nuclease of toxin-antitoxin system
VASADNEVFVSAASAWEMAIKVGIGKLMIDPDVEKWLPSLLAAYHFEPLAVSVAHAAHVESLPSHHRDPFDRLLIAQAALEGMRVVTANPTFARYPILVRQC